MTDSAEANQNQQARKVNVIDGVILAGIIGLATMIFGMRDSMIQLQEQIKSQNMLLANVQLQLADVPNMSMRISRIEVRQEANMEAIKEMRAIRER